MTSTSTRRCAPNPPIDTNREIPRPARRRAPPTLGRSSNSATARRAHVRPAGRWSSPLEFDVASRDHRPRVSQKVNTIVDPGARSRSGAAHATLCRIARDCDTGPGCATGALTLAWLKLDQFQARSRFSAWLTPIVTTRSGPWANSRRSSSMTTLASARAKEPAAPQPDGSARPARRLLHDRLHQ